MFIQQRQNKAHTDFQPHIKCDYYAASGMGFSSAFDWVLINIAISPAAWLWG